MAGSIGPRKRNLPLLRAKRMIQYTLSVNAEMNRGKTYPFIRTSETPPLTAIVMARRPVPAKAVARIDSNIVLWSSAKSPISPGPRLKDLCGLCIFQVVEPSLAERSLNESNLA